jgi:Protein of unknown function (DUF3105)
MSSRAEEKRRRREERLAQERAAAQAARRQGVLRTAGAAALGVALVVGVVVAIAASRGGGDGSSASQNGSATAVALPAPMETDLKAAARAAGCALRDYPSFGQEHTTGAVTYKSNPPTSGPHNPQPAQDGAYAPGDQPAVAQTVHSLEHGRVELQWRPGTSQRTIGRLQSLFNEQGGYHALLFENQTKMPYQVAASAWRHSIGCPKVTAATFDALRDFRKAYTDKGPEQVP